MLKARNLSYQLQESYLIKDITLDFLPGILYGILGPNGSGKSTLLKSLSGIWQPTEGKVLWHEEELLNKPRKTISQIVSLVPQNPYLHFEFTVYDFVAMGKYPCQESVNGDEIEWALKTVDVWHLRKRAMSQLSVGEKQRAYIARSLVTGAPIMLLDEPTASIDIKHQLQIWKLLKALIHQGKTIVVAIHDLSTTARFCDQIVVLDKGECIGQGSFADVMRPHLLREVFGVVEKSTSLSLAYELA